MNKKIWLGLGFIALFAFLIVLIGTGYGGKFSCSDGVISVGKATMPSLSVADTGQCKVEAKFYVNDELICEKNSNINMKGYVDCDKLKDFKGEEVLIEAKFFDFRGNEILEDKKSFQIK